MLRKYVVNREFVIFAKTMSEAVKLYTIKYPKKLVNDVLVELAEP